MVLEKQFDELIRLLSVMPDFSNFVLEESGKTDLCQLILSDIISFAISQKTNLQIPKLLNLYCDKSNNHDVGLWVQICLEKYNIILYDSNGISFINPDLQINDSDIMEQYFSETANVRSSKFIYKGVEKRKYKTIRENIAYRKVDFSNIYSKYLECNHPYICTEIALAYINAKRFDIGLTFLKKTIIQVFVGENKYWHNPLAIYGCIDAVYELQHLMGLRFMFDFFNKEKSDGLFLLECIYLYLSRAIYLPSSPNIREEYISRIDIEKANYLSMRANLIYDYKYFFSMIFPIGVNPDIQFMSDKYLAYNTLLENGLEVIGKDDFWDSMKMYQNGSLWVNSSGGYKDIEDATFGELVDRGKHRSFQLAKKLFESYKQGYFVLTMNQIDDLICSLYEKLITGNSF